MTAAEAHTLTGAYALDAVTDLERVTFTRHVAECPTCAREVGEFRETAAKLGLAATTVAGTRLRSRILTEVAMTRQTPPAVGTEARPRRPWYSRAVVTAAAAAALLVGGIGIGALRSDPSPTTPIAGAAQVQEAPDASLVRATSSDGGSVVVSFSRQRGEAVITAQGLPPLAVGHAYQVWLIGDRGAQSAGLLRVTSGSVTAPLPVDVDRIGITAEPEAGSPQPTTSAVVRVGLV
ncbi:anti-sigma factor [Amycolatopsis sp. NBC_01488]|uniref:anti-sigma factor n=1 Tax=Amycolatopsis sp. NBC_01488 TaxID=2903563 RepID=UPI002E29B6F4|nr:anti-sigma factor [Amycolatopsis sp. NBC_01488]